MASPAQPVRITWEFPINASEMGVISPDMENQQIKLLFASAQKADAFFQNFSLIRDEFEPVTFPVQKVKTNDRELQISTSGSSLFAVICALHYTIRSTSGSNYSNPYRFTLIQQ